MTLKGRHLFNSSPFPASAESNKATLFTGVILYFHMREFNFVPQAPAVQLLVAPTRQPWKPYNEIMLATVS